MASFDLKVMVLIVKNDLIYRDIAPPSQTKEVFQKVELSPRLHGHIYSMRYPGRGVIRRVSARK